jgi:uncharacterized protein with ATP-grasp and redox domains
MDSAIEFSLAPSVDLSAWPPPLHTAEPGSFAHNTFKRRIPPIIDDIVAANAFPPDILAAMASLRDEIVSGTIQPLREDAPDAAFWNAASADHIGHRWLDAPWYWAEAYFYRRVLECTRYFQLNHPWFGRDPYAARKEGEIQPDRAPRLTDQTLAGLPHDDQNKCFRLLCYASLWGNRVDLSYNVAQHIAPAASLEDERAHLLVDDTQRVWSALSARPGGAVAVITDNAGSELLMDLALVDCILGTGLASRVVLHVKPQPYYVSDAMIKDVLHSVEALGRGGSHAAALSRRLQDSLAQDRLRFHAHWFYTSCLMYYQMPADLRETIAGMDFVILKGDANYRRLLGDAHWEPATPFDTVVSYFPTPLLALRTLKAEVIVGLPAGEAERLFAVEPDWRTNGRRGVAQARL